MKIALTEELERAIGAYLLGLRPDPGESGEVVTQTGERLRGQAVDGKTARCATACISDPVPQGPIFFDFLWPEAPTAAGTCITAG